MTKHDHKNFEVRLILQLGNVQKNQYIIMNIMYTTLHYYTNEQRESGKIIYFAKRTAIFFLLAWTFLQPADTLNQR
jgi:hypothetical protein